MTVTRKLLLINTLICVAFIVMIMVVFFSFRYVEKVLTTSFAAETHRIIENSNMTRELSRILSDMNLILRTFHENSEILKIRGASLLKATQALLAKSGDEEMRACLNRFKEHFTNIVTQCEKVNFVREELRKIEKNFDDDLISLDNIIAQKLVEMIVEGGNISYLEQLSIMIGGWRESFIRMKLQFVQLGLEHFKHPMEGHKHPLLTQADNLKLRLRTLTAASSDIAGHGRNLIHLLSHYEACILKVHRSVGVLGRMLEENDREKEKLLSVMERADKQVAEKTDEATNALNARIDRSIMINFIIFLGILPIVILGGLTAFSIKKPIGKIIEYIRCLSKGDIPDPIKEEYQGEFAEIIDYLNLLIKATNTVTQIAENIAAGNMETLVKERSGNDRLMQALNRMIQRLELIISETRSMIQTVGEGRMDIRGNVEAFEGGWRELLSGVNDLIDGLSSSVARSAALGQEMELARNIQTCLLPASVEDIHPDFNISAFMLPADEVGGDFYEITLDREGRLRLAIGDVSGHGITPGLIMMMAQTIHSTVIANLDNDARSAVIKINNILYANVHERLRENHFMTLNVLKYLGSGKFEHAGAHLRIIVYRRESDKCELIMTKGVYLNFKKDVSKATKNGYFDLGEGDIMVLYTDGLTEARNSEGELLDIERFVNIIVRYARFNPDPEVMKENIMVDVLKWCDNRRDDDMTLVVVKRKGGVDG